MAEMESTLVNCPVCNVETTMRVVNQHLDRGCPRQAENESQNVNIAPMFLSQKKRNEPRNENKNSSPRMSSQGSIDSATNDDISSQKRSVDSDKPTDSELSREKKRLKLSTIPLAEQIRPKSLSDFIGQEDLVGQGGILKRFIEHDVCPSIILWGSSGVGRFRKKTSCSNC